MAWNVPCNRSPKLLAVVTLPRYLKRITKHSESVYFWELKKNNWQCTQKNPDTLSGCNKLKD